MANFIITDIAIKGISACVPKNEVHNEEAKIHYRVFDPVFFGLVNLKFH